MNFLRNTWYVAAWDEELKPGQMLQRRLLDEPVLLLRASGGEVSALYDRCPHRFAPLHMGTFDGESLQCRYHGLKFNGHGECGGNPHGAIPHSACARCAGVTAAPSLLRGANSSFMRCNYTCPSDDETWEALTDGGSRTARL